MPEHGNVNDLYGDEADAELLAEAVWDRVVGRLVSGKGLTKIEAPYWSTGTRAVTALKNYLVPKGAERIAREMFTPLEYEAKAAVRDFSGALCDPEEKPKILPSEFLAEPVRSSKRPALDQWEQDRKRAIAATNRSAWLGATRIAEKGKQGNAASDDLEALDEDPDNDLDGDKVEEEEGTEVRSRSGRGGTAFGSAVHGVLERLDLAQAVEAVSDAGNDDVKFNTRLTELAKSQADTEGLTEQAAEVESRVRSVLADPTVAAAARSRHWQEIYVGALAASPKDSDGIVVDGFVDLLYEDPGSSNVDQPDLVVLDFKTSSSSDEKSLKSRTEYYSLQGATYAYCVQKATGRTVSRVEFAFLTEKGVRIHTVEGKKLDDAIAEVLAIAEER